MLTQIKCTCMKWNVLMLSVCFPAAMIFYGKTDLTISLFVHPLCHLLFLFVLCFTCFPLNHNLIIINSCLVEEHVACAIHIYSFNLLNFVLFLDLLLCVCVFFLQFFFVFFHLLDFLNLHKKRLPCAGVLHQKFGKVKVKTCSSTFWLFTFPPWYLDPVCASFVNSVCCVGCCAFYPQCMYTVHWWYTHNTLFLTNFVV